MDILLLVIVGGFVTYHLAKKFLGDAPSTAEIINDAVGDTPTEDYSGLTKAQLLDVAKHQGVKVTTRSTKAQIIEALK
jgi:hypothetical protein